MFLSVTETVRCAVLVLRQIVHMTLAAFHGHMFSAPLSVVARKGALSDMNWVILLAVAAASWRFVEVEPHHLQV